MTVDLFQMSILYFQEMDSWYKSKFENITKKTTGHVDKVRGIREEIAGAKKTVSIKTC